MTDTTHTKLAGDSMRIPVEEFAKARGVTILPLNMGKDKIPFRPDHQGKLCMTGQCNCANQSMLKGRHFGAVGIKMLHEPVHAKKRAECQQAKEYTALMMDAKPGIAYAQLDVDYINSKAEDGCTDMSSITDFHPWYRSMTKRQPKIPVKLMWDKELPLPDRFPATKWPGVELLCGMSYALRGEMVENADKCVVELALSDILTESQYDKWHSSHQKKSADKAMCMPSDVSPDMRGVIDLIAPEHVSSYDSWLKIGAAMRHSGYSCEDFHRISQKTLNLNYDEDAVDKKWDECEKMTEHKFGTLIHYAKLSDPAGVQALQSAQNMTNLMLIAKPSEPTMPQASVQVEDKPADVDVKDLESIQIMLMNGGGWTNNIAGMIFEAYNKGRYAYSQKTWYRLNHGGIYQALTTDAKTILTKECRNCIYKFISYAIENLTKTEDNETQRAVKIGIMKQGLTESQNNSYMKHTIEYLTSVGDLHDEGLSSKLDKNLKLIGFTNGVYDLDAGIFRKATREDHISMTTQQEWTPDEANGYFDDLIQSIFEDSEREEYFKRHLGSLIVGGNKEEKLTNWINDGRGGKGTMDSLLKASLGDYYGSIEASYYTSGDTDVNKASPAVLKFKNIRVAVTQEPAGQHQPWATEKIKRTTGGDPLTGRELYGRLETFVPHHKPIICTNHLPVFTDIDDGLLSRLSIIRFPLQFMDAENFDGTNPKHRKQNANLKTELKKYQPFFINYLIKYAKVYMEHGLPDLPPSMRAELHEYQKEVDAPKLFMQTNVQALQGNNLPVNDLYDAFRQTEDVTIKAFSLHLKRLGYATARKVIDGRKVNCVCNYGWK